MGESTGTNDGDSDIMVLANTHTHTHTCINTRHPCNWHVPQEGKNARQRGSSRELIRAWIHTLRALTPHSPPACFLPVIVPRSSARETHTTRWPPNSCSLYDKFTSVVLEGASERTVCVCVCGRLRHSSSRTFNHFYLKSQNTGIPAVYLLITQLSLSQLCGMEQ